MSNPKQTAELIKSFHLTELEERVEFRKWNDNVGYTVGTGYSDQMGPYVEGGVRYNF